MYSVIQDSSANNGYADMDIKTFLIDTSEDLETLPSCSSGSVAYTANLQNIYVLSNDKQWTKVGE